MSEPSSRSTSTGESSDPAALELPSRANAAGLSLPADPRSASAAAAAGVGDLTDDVAAAEWAGAPAYVFEGDPANSR